MGNLCTSRHVKPYCDTHFALLPEELLVEILRYVSISDLWNFCEAFKDIRHLLKERALTRNINLKGWYDVNTNRIFVKINPEIVTSLNLNYCHWLRHEDLLSFVGKCANLEILLALGTKLKLSDGDIKSYNKTKITKLAVTITKNHTIARTAVLDRVISLALEIDCNMFDVCLPEEFYRLFPSLQRVWVEVDGISRVYSCSEWTCKWLKTYKSGQLQELFYCYHMMRWGYMCPTLLPNLADASKLCFSYNGLKDNEKEVFCFANIENHEELVQYYKPYGRRVAKLFHSGAKTLETIQFEELNFSQWPRNKWHPHDCNRAHHQLLMSPNARNIEKLTICICHLNDCKDDDAGVLKKFNNLRFLQLLDYCKRSAHLEDLQEYNSLGNLTKLRYLFVEMPSNCDGNFLFDVLKKCRQLETLRIDNNLYNNREHDNKMKNQLHKGLEHSANLKELILEHFAFLNIDDLLSLLIQSKRMKLQKLALSCKNTYRLDEEHKSNLEFFSLELLTKYMRSNPQLVDCRFYIACLKKGQIELIKQQMSSFNTSYRVFDISGDYSKGWSTTFKNTTLSRFNLMEDIGTF